MQRVVTFCRCSESVAEICFRQLSPSSVVLNVPELCLSLLDHERE